MELGHRVLLQLLLELCLCGYQLLERAILVRGGHFTHRLQLLPPVLERVLPVYQPWHLLRVVGHDLAEEHVLEGGDGAGVVLGLESLKGLVEVGVGRLVVFLLRVQRAALRVDLGLEERRAVDGIGGCARRGERSLAPGHVAQLVVCAALHEVDFNQQRLIVKFLHLPQQLTDQRKRCGVVFHLEIHAGKLCLDTVAQEGALLLLTPLDSVEAQLHLHPIGTRDLGHELYQRSHNFCCFRLRDVHEEWSNGNQELLEVFDALLVSKQLPQFANGLFLNFVEFLSISLFSCDRLVERLCLCRLEGVQGNASIKSLVHVVQLALHLHLHGVVRHCHVSVA
mmetsp:Transcript_15424/g.30922  ORF Transcript_15424/g.30922 Transcript_15424/m.30922 type:complete len:338 (-) Transcript_15424:58-1071(-)